MGDNHSTMSRVGSKRAVLLASVLVTLFALSIYLRTMAPTITWQNHGADSGDLVTAAVNLGVPHPTGYPLYTMLAHLFTRLPGPEPAWKVTLFSAVAAALAVGAVFWACHRLLETRTRPAHLALLAAWTAAGLYAFGDLLWSQATIAEVYSLYALLAAALLAAALSASRRIRPYVLTLLFGLGLAHHVTIVFLLPALWPYLPTICKWPTPRRLLRLAMCLLPGLLTYAYIPLRAGANPVPNWGRADNLAGFTWLVSGAAYRPYVAVLSRPYLQQRLPAWLSLWTRELGVLGLALAILGLWRWLETDRRFGLFSLTYVLLLSGYIMVYITADAYLYLIPAAMVVATWTAKGAMTLLDGLQNCVNASVAWRWIGAAATLALVALPPYSLVSRFSSMDLSTDREAYAFAKGVLNAASPSAIVICSGDRQAFALWYVHDALGHRPDVMVIERRLLALDWYRDNLAARYGGLAMVTDAHSAQEALTLLIQIGSQSRPIHLTFSDETVLQLGRWDYSAPLYTLVDR